MATNPAFIDFLREEIRQRDFESVRQFAVWLGMSNSMVSQVMDGSRDPGMGFMIALSNKTGVSMIDLVELAQPGALKQRNLPATTLILAQQIERLGDDERTLIRSAVRGMLYGEKRKDRQQTSDGETVGGGEVE
jgi:transcriptional regulator with XRE-family HTH domain